MSANCRNGCGVRPSPTGWHVCGHASRGIQALVRKQVRKQVSKLVRKLDTCRLGAKGCLLPPEQERVESLLRAARDLLSEGQPRP